MHRQQYDDAHNRRDHESRAKPESTVEKTADDRRDDRRYPHRGCDVGHRFGHFFMIASVAQDRATRYRANAHAKRLAKSGKDQ